MDVLIKEGIQTLVVPQRKSEAVRLRTKGKRALELKRYEQGLNSSKHRMIFAGNYWDAGAGGR